MGKPCSRQPTCPFNFSITTGANRIAPDQAAPSVNPPALLANPGEEPRVRTVPFWHEVHPPNSLSRVNSGYTQSQTTGITFIRRASGRAVRERSFPAQVDRWAIQAGRTDPPLLETPSTGSQTAFWLVFPAKTFSIKTGLNVHATNRTRESQGKTAFAVCIVTGKQIGRAHV